MDEEQQQPNKKIDLDSFFNRVDQVEGVANKALKTANSNLSVINANKTLINSLSVSIEAMRTQIRDVANYIIVERKLEKDEEADRRFEEEDAKQKKDMDERLKNLQPADGKDGAPGPVGDGGKDGKSSGGGLGGFIGGLIKVVGGLTLAAGFAALAPIIVPAILVGGGALLLTFLTSKLLEKLLPKLGKFFTDTTKKIRESFKNFREEQIKKFNAMKEAFTKNFNALKDKVTNIAKAGLEKTKRGIAGAADFLTGGVFDFDKKGESESDKNIVGSLFKNVKNTVESITKDIKESGVTQTAKNIAKSGITTVSNVAISARDNAIETASKVKEKAAEGLEVVKEVKDKAISIVSEKVQGGVDAAKEVSEKVKEVATDGKNVIKEKFEEVKEKSLNILDPKDRIVTKAKETVVEKVTDVKERGILGVLGGIADKVTMDKFDFDNLGKGVTPDKFRTPRQKVVPSQVSDAEIKTTLSPIPFVKSLKNQYLSISPSRNQLPPEIARMIQ